MVDDLSSLNDRTCLMSAMFARHLINHRNRSQLSLEQDRAPSPGFTPQSAPSPQFDDVEDEGYGIQYRSDERFYRSDQATQPSRSYSQRETSRAPTSINTHQPRITVGPHNSASTPSSAIDDNPDRYYYQQGPTQPVQKAEPTKKKRGFFGLGSSSTKDSSKGAPQKLGRSVSVKRKEEPKPPSYEKANHGTQQQRWSTSDPSIADEEEEEEAGGSSLRTTQFAYTPGGPPLPDKDPLRSPAFPPPLTHEEYIYGRSQPQHQNPNNSNRHPLERQGSQQSAWEKTVHQATKHSRSESAQPLPASYHPSPSSANSTSSHPFGQKTPLETLHQYHHENSRPPSQQSLEPPTSSQHFRTPDYSGKQGQYPLALGGHVQGSMGPPPGQQPPPNRRSSESTQQSQQSQGREGGVYQPYNQGPQQGSVLPANAPPPGYTAQHAPQLAPQGQAYRGTSQTAQMAQLGHREQDGRGSPPPSRSRDDLSNLDVAQLLQRHDELRMVTSLSCLSNKFLYQR